MTVSVLWLFLTVPWVGQLCVIVVFPDWDCALLEMVETPIYSLEFMIDLLNVIRLGIA